MSRMKNREEFIKILRQVERPGVEELISWLDTTDFSLLLLVQDFMEVTQVDLYFIL